MTASWDHAVRRDRLRQGLCPGCGVELHTGYGLMGGGIGAYVVCLAEECPDPHFEKWPDYELEGPGPDAGEPAGGCAIGTARSPSS